MLNRLNDAQRQLVADNHNLIYKYLDGKHLSMDSVEDWYGAAAVGLCKAGIIFDKTRGLKFSTLAFVCMENEVRGVLRRISKYETHNVLSLDYPIDETETLTFGDLIPDECNY